jgi:hypothetical protein
VPLLEIDIFENWCVGNPSCLFGFWENGAKREGNEVWIFISIYFLKLIINEWESSTQIK